MKLSNSNCIGVDLTQSVPHIAVASGSAKVESSIPASSPPAALLPVLRGESIIAGAVAHTHRRGIGGNWPPECQVPVGGNFKNGTGRVPLVCAWTRLANLSSQTFSGVLGDTEVSWQPSGQIKLGALSEKIISDSVQAWEKKYHSKKTVVVVPDSLGEAAQQALIDNCGSFLIPRPIAVAMSWCRKNADKFSEAVTQSPRGATLGHLLVVTLTFDQWEVVPIEIRIMAYKEKIWLIPVRNRVAGGGEFPRLGVNFFLAMATSKEESLQGIWKNVFGSGLLTENIDNHSSNMNLFQSVRDCITDGFSSRVEDLFHKLDLWGEIFTDSIKLSPGMFQDHLSVIYRKQLSCLPENAHGRCLGVVLDGSCSYIQIAKNRSLGEFVAGAFKDQEIAICNGAEAARGAAITAFALEHNLPSYRETIIPIDIHYHGKNEQGDYVNAYKLLVEGTTVEAGKEYKSKEPVRGLYIKQGERNITLTLRRSSERDLYLFRKVTAEIPKPTTFDEEVKIVAHLRPGQGFANVFVDSVNENVFRTRLDWRTMGNCEEPPPPPLAYLPEVSRVVHDEYMWRDAEYYVKVAIRELRGGGANLEGAMRDLRNQGKFNQWPMADDYDVYRGQQPQGDIFRHYGVCPSDGDLDSVSSPSLMREFANECEKKFVNIRIRPSERKQLQQTASWMYLACPQVIIVNVRKNLKNNLALISQEDLHTIGLCWSKSDDISMFFNALDQRLRQGTIGVNNWLRACRNIVRFRDAALHVDIIGNGQLNKIVDRILKILERQVEEENFSIIFNNCILTCLYLLKRRRYDKDFLNNESPEYDRIDQILRGLLKKQSKNLNDRQCSIIKTTLKFLRKEASLKDLDSSVLTG
ncbi:hypothetical protein JWG42_13970 [Desulfoprunum benzoelyticum]|uniref:Uncharacterized protein n=1 Tax=Desulfoprunum benzoelyticum TaxID=1506996 RepID=A0A840UV17_9BACT|nr:hypothetical protein [Desulfoprunum benzoelyticum]MBB5349535.1 hypothetical protein [Desulfoprunum benzoelyticum]MBM9531262.1 hypothetical protein [Desulfoprunum benzoelyticum]